MNRVLFVLKSVSTHNRQNAICVECVAEHLKQLGCEVDYISWEMNELKKGYSNIFPVYFNFKKNLFNKLIYKFIHFVYVPIAHPRLINLYKKKIEEILKLKKYDAVIAVSNPVESAEALARIRHISGNTKLIMYEIDPNSTRYKTPKNFIEKYWNHRSEIWEKRVYSKMDYVIHMMSHKKHFLKDAYKASYDKSIFLDIPNFIPNNNLISRKSNTLYFKMIYSGAFYPVLREPYKLFELIEILKKKINFEFDIYTGNSMREKLIDLSRNGEVASVHDEIPQNVLNDIIFESDVLISVGNKDSDFLPSKILMYMSTGKPIIHLYADDNDVSKQYLSYYPYVFFIDERDAFNDSLIDRLVEFVKCSRSNYVNDFSDLKTKLIRNTPEYTALSIMEMLK